jgi:hypothetical protein
LGVETCPYQELRFLSELLRGERISKATLSKFKRPELFFPTCVLITSLISLVLKKSRLNHLDSQPAVGGTLDIVSRSFCYLLRVSGSRVWCLYKNMFDGFLLFEVYC